MRGEDFYLCETSFALVGEFGERAVAWKSQLTVVTVMLLLFSPSL